MDMTLDEVAASRGARGGGKRGGRGRGRTGSRPAAPSRSNVSISRRGRGGAATGRGGRAGKSSHPKRAKKTTGEVELIQHGFSHITNASLEDVAAADENSRVLMVGKATEIKRLAGSITFVVDECGAAPTLIASGSEPINQAMKALAIVRRVYETKGVELDMLVRVIFEPGSSKSSIIIEVTEEIYENEATEGDFLVKHESDPYKVAGAIAGRVRNQETVGLQAVGPQSVYNTVKALSLAKSYLKKDEIDLRFTPAWTTSDDERQTTGLHFAVHAFPAE